MDVGGPIIDESAWKNYLDKRLVAILDAEGISVTEDGFAEARRRAVKKKVNRPTITAIGEFVSEEREATRIFGAVYEELRTANRRGEELPRFLAKNASVGLRRLRTSYRLAILSNNISKVRYLLDIAGVTDYFDGYFISEEVGSAKPDEAIFNAALGMVGCTPNEAMMVGDRLDNDIEPARRLGMQTALICGAAGESEISSKNAGEADIICADLLELAGILKT
ncbi:MAG: HAD family hydrolase [bacterium]|nr:HAD family hydrolase [bacterium]